MNIEVASIIQTDEFTGFEFVTNEELYIEDADQNADFFRLELHKNEAGEIEEEYILLASRDDYYVYDDVSFEFDFEDIKRACLNAANVENSTDDYLEFIKTETEADQEDINFFNIVTSR